MIKRVTKTKKDRDGDILAMCNTGEWLSPVSKDKAIREIEVAGKPYSTNSPYYTDFGGIKASIVVIDDTVKGKYLRTDPDKTKKNNLLALPDC